MLRTTKCLAPLCAGLLLLAGCVLPNDPAVADRSDYWYRHTDPAAFFAHEQARGRVYFVGVYDPALGEDSPVPGVSAREPEFRVAQTWFVPLTTDLNPRRNQRRIVSVREFARRYNPLVLAYLQRHPEGK